MESGTKAFRPLGNLTVIAASGAAPAGVQVSCVNRSPQEPTSYSVSNPSLVDAYLSWGATDAIAQTNAVIPTAGNSKPNVVFSPAKSVLIFKFPGNSFFSGITGGGDAGLLVQSGEGL